MAKHNSKTRNLSKKELEEVMSINSQKYLSKTLKIKNMHALQKYLFWINNYYESCVRDKIKNIKPEIYLNYPEVIFIIDRLTDYAKNFITLGYTKYFDYCKFTACSWAETCNKNASKGDYSGLILTMNANDTGMKYFHLSCDTPYLNFKNLNYQYHKITQYVAEPTVNDNITDSFRDTFDNLAYMFIPAPLARQVEQKIVEFIKGSNDIMCWVILQTGHSLE